VQTNPRHSPACLFTNSMNYIISIERSVKWHDFAELIQAVGWGVGCDQSAFDRSSSAYPLVAHASGFDGQLLGYVSALIDGVYSTMLGELIVRPTHQRMGIGRALLAQVEATYPNVPIYVKALGSAKLFFESCGYRRPASEMTVLYKKNTLIDFRHARYLMSIQKIQLLLFANRIHR